MNISLTEKINEVKKLFEKDLSAATDTDRLETLRIKYAGKKGFITEMTKMIAGIPNEEKPKAGKAVNLLKNDFLEKFEQKSKEIKKKKYEEKITKEKIDVTLPGRAKNTPTYHPLWHITREITEIFSKMGFLNVSGPEIEKEYYNFEALNMPQDHPARDSQDSFYLGDHFLLRTQTSPVQIRTMEHHKPPLAIISPGRVYRRDTIDASHSPIFHQLEGLFIDKDVSMAELKGLLHNFCKEMFSEKSEIRLRPDYFPFTEPSCEISVSCTRCGGKGCATCGGDGWLEILGAGLVNPKVLMNVGIDPNQYSGLAFGMGIERIAMLKYQIPDIRAFYENNYKFLEQFKMI